MTRALGFALALMLLGPAPVAAQQPDSMLLAATRLATEGRGDSARSLVRAKLRTTVPTDTMYPAVLYAAAVIAGTTDSALFYLRRVSIEHPASAWADQALLRLAQLAYASGDFAGARRSAERVLMDYPSSDVLADAGFWAARAHFELGDVAEGCRLLTRAEADAGENLELANRVRYYSQRCLTPVVRDTAVRDTGAAPGRVYYAVQVAAVQSPAAADELMRQLSTRGYQPRVVSEGGLFKVRVGRFALRDDAQRLAGDLRTAVGGSPFVVEER